MPQPPQEANGAKKEPSKERETGGAQLAQKYLPLQRMVELARYVSAFGRHRKIETDEVLYVDDAKLADLSKE